MKERQRKRKVLVEQATFPYKKIVVPVTMRSIYWKYFGFPANESGEILSRSYIICTICQRQIRNNHNTTNIRIHLSNKHADFYQELLASSSLTTEIIKSDRDKVKKLHEFSVIPKNLYSMETNMEGTLKIMNGCEHDHEENDGTKVISCKIDVSEQNDHTYGESDNNVEEFYLQSNENDAPMDGHTLSEIITKFIVMDMHSPDIVNGSGFLLLVATLQPSAEIPTVEKVEHELLPTLYDDTKTSLIEKISELKAPVSLSIEEWTSSLEQNYATFSINYVDNVSSTIHTRVLKTIHCIEDSNHQYWSQVFINVCSEFNISTEIISAVVTGWCRNSIIQAIAERGIIVVPCAIEMIQKCAEACFNDEDVADVINKICSSVHLPVDEEDYYEDCRSVWLSTYSFLEKCLQMKNSLESVHEFVDEDWRIVRDVLAVLSPLQTTVVTLCETKLPMISVIKPIMWQLLTSHFKVKISDNRLISKLKSMISNILSDSYTGNSLSMFLTTAAFLDTRFKLLPYASKPEFEEVKRSIQNLMRHSMKSKSNNTMTKERKRISGMELLLGQVCSTTNQNNPETAACVEFTSFQSEAAVSLDQCPLEWWFHNEKKYPQLFEIVCPYLCVPVCSIGLERMSWKKAVSYQSRRAALSKNVLDRIIFVNSNYLM